MFSQKKRSKNISREEYEFNLKQSASVKVLALQDFYNKYLGFELIYPKRAMWCYIGLWSTISALEYDYSWKKNNHTTDFDFIFYSDKQLELKKLRETVHNKLILMLDKVIKEEPMDYFLERPKLIAFALIFSNTFLEQYKDHLPQIFSAFIYSKDKEGMSELNELCREKYLNLLSEKELQKRLESIRLIQKHSPHSTYQSQLNDLEKQLGQHIASLKDGAESLLCNPEVKFRVEEMVVERLRPT